MNDGAGAVTAASASDRLRALARRVAQAHVGLAEPVMLSLLSGSVVEDIADALSDVDMSVVFETLPAEAELRAACAKASGLPWFWQAGSLAESGLVVAFRLDGVEVQIGYNDLATLQREVDQVLVDHDPGTPQHKLAEGLLKAEPLIGATRLEALQRRLAVFPPPLGRPMKWAAIARLNGGVKTASRRCNASSRAAPISGSAFSSPSASLCCGVSGSWSTRT